MQRVTYMWKWNYEAKHKGNSSRVGWQTHAIGLCLTPFVSAAKSRTFSFGAIVGCSPHHSFFNIVLVDYILKL